MPTGRQRSSYEFHLAAASRALYKAAEHAERNGMEGEFEDCHQIRREVQRLMDSSIRNKRVVPRGQMALET